MNFQDFISSQKFFEDNQNLMANCRIPQGSKDVNSNVLKFGFLPNNGCVDLNEAQPIKYIFEKMFSTQNQNEISVIPNPKHVQIRNNLRYENTSTFKINCLSIQKENNFFNYCDGSHRDKNKGSNYYSEYILSENESSWTETITSSGQSSARTFSKQESPQLFEKFIEQINLSNPSIDSIKQIDQLSDPIEPENPAISSKIINPIDMALFALGVFGIGYCIYKIHSMITKHWKCESQNEKPIKQA